METVPGGGSSLEVSLMWWGVAAGDLTPMKHLAVSALRPDLQRRPAAAKPHRHTPLSEDVAQHLPHLTAVALPPARAPVVLLKTNMSVIAVLVAPGSRQVSAAAFTSLGDPDRLTAATPPPKLSWSRLRLMTSAPVLIFILLTEPPLPIITPPSASLQVITFVMMLTALFAFLFQASKLLGVAAVRTKACGISFL